PPGVDVPVAILPVNGVKRVRRVVAGDGDVESLRGVLDDHEPETALNRVVLHPRVAPIGLAVGELEGIVVRERRPRPARRGTRWSRSACRGDWWTRCRGS